MEKTDGNTLGWLDYLRDWGGEGGIITTRVNVDIILILSSVANYWSV